MWEIQVFKLEKDEPKSDPYEFAPFKYRGTAVNKNVKQIKPEQYQLFVEFDRFAFSVTAKKHPPEPKVGLSNKLLPN